MPELQRSIALIGAGKMGSALLKGWLAGGPFARAQFHVFDPAPADGLDTLKSPAVAINPPTDKIADPEIVVVAVKPQILSDILPTLKSVCRPNTLVVSVAAGKKIAEFETALGEQPIVRVMPNTPSIVGKGISALFANAHVDSAQRKLSEDLLAAVGEVVWLEREEDMDAVTAVSGSGPAYVFLLAECLAEAAIEQGLAPPLARQLARATLSGAGALLEQSEEDATKLRENVTSPGGTTAAALSVLMENRGLGELMSRAIAAATRRSRELGE